MERRRLFCITPGSSFVLYVEDEIEDGVLSCVDTSMEHWYLVHPDGLVTDDRGDGNIYGQVTSWDYKGKVE